MPAGRFRLILWILMFMCALNFMDRQVINILAEPIKNEFHLSDAQLGLLSGLAFAVLHAVFSLPAAYIADRTNRLWVLGGSMTIWSIGTVASGFAGSFAGLCASRMLVGLGQAGGIAPAHAVIASRVPKERRARALAFYSIGIPLGGLLGLALGGLLLDGYGWRTAFLVAGAPGLLIGPILLLAGRREADRMPPDPLSRKPAMSYRATLSQIVSKKAFLLVTGAGAVTALVNFGQGAFIASFFFRTHARELAELSSRFSAATGAVFGAAALLGVALGLARGLTGIAGTLAGGQLTDRLNRDSGYAAYVTVPALMAVLRIPLIIGGLVVGDIGLAFALFALQWLLAGVGITGGFAAVQGLVPIECRATAAAIYSLGINLLGFGLGPLLVGIASDSLAAEGFGSAEGLRWALVASSFILLVAAAMNWHARRFIGRESVS